MTPDQNLSDLAGKPGGYPADWSPVCGDQLALYYEWLGELRRQQAELIGVSADGVWCHGAYAASQLGFPAARRFCAVARSYRGYREQDGSASALFVVDTRGVIFWS